MINNNKILHPLYFSFSGPNHIPSLIFRTNLGPYDICYGYICYFDKFDRNRMYSHTTIELSIFICLCVLEYLTLDKSKSYFVEMKT